MKIFLTKKQYDALVDLLYLADWVMNAHSVSDLDESSHHGDVIQALLAQARAMHAEELVESFGGRSFPSRLVEDRMQSIIDEYDQTSMWEDLIAELALRDAIRAVGGEALSRMDGEERFRILSDHEELWGKEFEEHGLSRVVIERAAAAKLNSGGAERSPGSREA